NGGHPLVVRIDHARRRRSVRNDRTVVVDAVRDEGPAVVAARRYHIEFVATLRSVFQCPNQAVAGIADQALRIAVSVAVDFGKRMGTANERIVVRYRSIGGEADDFAAVLEQVLRMLHLHVLTEGQIDQSIGTEGKAAADHIDAFESGPAIKNDLLVD